VLEFRKLTVSIRVAPAIKEYVVDLVRATRDPAAYGPGLAPLLELGASPRGHYRPDPRRPWPRPPGPS
jgi:MoxR-like ATPase